MDFSNVTHISFSNSGLDTDTLVQKLMKAEQVPLDKLKQNQQKDLWLSDAYRQWNTTLNNFNTQTAFKMTLSTNFNTFDVSSSLSNSVTAVGTSSAVEGTYNLAVKQIAQSATFTGNTANVDLTQTFESTGQMASNTSTKITLSVNSDPNNPTNVKTADITINSTDTINDVISRINSATDTNSGQSLGIKAIYDSNLRQFFLKTNSTGAATKIDLSGTNDPTALSFLKNTLGLGQPTVTGGAVPSTSTVTAGSNDSFSIDLGNGTSDNLTLVAGTYNTPQDYINQVNTQISNSANLKGKVLASLDSAGNLVFSSKVIGTSQLSVTASNPLSLPPGFSSSSMTGTMSAIGTNADIIFNGKEISTSSTNNVNLLGVNYTLKGPTLDTAGNPVSSTITVSRNIDTEMKNIEDFISKYNDTLSQLNTAILEPVYKDYQPLTDDQKSQMSDTQITQWETKAKSGLMHSNPILSDLVNKMRTSMTSVVNNGSTYNSLASIGITSHSYQDQGKLYVDEDKLRAALQNDPDGVKKLFSQVGTGAGNQGIANSLNDNLDATFTQLVNKAGSTSGSQYDQSFIGKDLSSLQTQINDMTARLQDRENMYYQQYDAMNQAITKFQSQSSSLLQQLGITTNG